MVKFFYIFLKKNLFTILEKKRKRKLSDLNPHIHRCVAVRAGIYPVAPPWILVCFLLPGLLSSPKSIPRRQRRASQIFHLLHFQPRPHTSSRNLLPMAGGGGAGAGSSSGGGGGAAGRATGTAAAAATATTPSARSATAASSRASSSTPTPRATPSGYPAPGTGSAPVTPLLPRYPSLLPSPESPVTCCRCRLSSIPMQRIDSLVNLAFLLHPLCSL